MSDLDARTFQSQLDELTTTIAYKVQREGPRHGLKPDFLAADFFFKTPVKKVNCTVLVGSNACWKQLTQTNVDTRAIHDGAPT